MQLKDYISFLILFILLSACASRKSYSYKEKENIQFEKTYMDSLILKHIHKQWEKREIDILHYELMPPESINRQAISSVTQINISEKSVQTDTILTEQKHRIESSIFVDKEVVEESSKQPPKGNRVITNITIILIVTGFCLLIRYIDKKSKINLGR